jgi:hypothetical protein
MHLAAGLGLPIVCLFGNSGATRWRPWGVPYRLLQKQSLDVNDTSVNEVVAAFSALRDDLPGSGVGGATTTEARSTAKAQDSQQAPLAGSQGNPL